MVHNGVEYALMRLISETYHLMKQGLGLTNDELAAVYDEWDRSELNAYLIEITADIFRKVDEKSGKRLINVILDETRQKGTGMWTVEDALALQIPVPAIDAAVAMREMSILKAEREAASRILVIAPRTFQGDREAMLGKLRNALYAAMIVAYAQGMAQLRRASEAYGYHLKLEDVARIWRGGCIIRAAILEAIRAAFRARSDLPNLLVDPRLAGEMMARQEDLRRGARRGRIGHSRAGLHGVAGLLRQLSQRMAAGQPDRSAARLFWCAHLPARGRQRLVPYPVGGRRTSRCRVIACFAHALGAWP